MIGRITIFRSTISLFIAGVALSGCDHAPSPWLQGYVEAEFVYVSAGVPGRLETLSVSRGDTVSKDDKLFQLEARLQTAARQEANRRVAQARANLEDLTKGRRPTEVAAIEAQLDQAQTALELAEKESKRQEDLASTGATAVENLDRARSSAEQGRARVEELSAQLATARMGAREDQIAAAKEAAAAAEAAEAQAIWNLDQTTQAAPASGQVFDTLFRQGEWVAAGKPVVVLLPPENVKVRFFVPEPQLSGVALNQKVEVRVDGAADSISGTINFISPKAEYTPPVIYSADNRAKLVFMVEAAFVPDLAARLHPGQPVDVLLSQRP
jgi:HlyD family secretion protein